MVKLPLKGLKPELVLEQLAILKAEGMNDDIAAKFASNSLKSNQDIQAFIQQAYNQFFSYNALFSFQQASAAKLEDEVMQMCCDILGGEEARCNITSGGTESLFCALHAMREKAKTEHPDIIKPELIAPYSIHATVEKVCHFLQIELIRTPVADSLRADVAAMKQAIGPNSIGIIASAPSWPYALVDPIEELANIAIEHDLWFHVDACVGGYVLPFMQQIGADIPTFDFSIEGVSSISADLHKYGYAAKPCSTVLYRNKSLQHFHYVPITNWPCGLYVSQSFVGSRPLAATAAAWAILKHMGRDGYAKNAQQLLDIKQRIVSTCNAIEGLTCWPSEGPLLLIASDSDLDIQLIVGGMENKGWSLLGVNVPPAIHLTLDIMPEEDLDRFTSDLQNVAEAVRNGTLTSQGLLSYGGVGNTETAPKWLIELMGDE